MKGKKGHPLTLVARFPFPLLESLAPVAARPIVGAGALGVFEIGVMISVSGDLIVAGPGGSRTLQNKEPLGVAYDYTQDSRLNAWWK